MPPAPVADPRIEVLLDTVECAYRERAWHGPNLRNAVRGLDAEAAAWRPGKGRPTAWELAVHCAYWKYRVLRKLDKASPRSFDEPGSDFFPRPLPDSTPASRAATWSADRERLDAWHERLVAAIAAFPAERLDEISYDRYTHRGLIAGAAAHDVYHAGQIRSLRKLWEQRKASGVGAGTLSHPE